MPDWSLWVLDGVGIGGFAVAVLAVAGMWSILFVLGGLDQKLREHARAPWSSSRYYLYLTPDA